MAVIDAKDVQLSGCSIEFKDFSNAKSDKSIVSSKNSPTGDWNDVCTLDPHFEGVHKRVIPVDFRDFCMLVVTEVEPNTKISSHGHDEGIVRYIMEGSLYLNDELYTADDWILVPEGMHYDIFTETGYKAIAGYLMACTPPEPSS